MSGNDTHKQRLKKEKKLQWKITEPFNAVFVRNIYVAS